MSNPKTEKSEITFMHVSELNIYTFFYLQLIALFLDV